MKLHTVYFVSSFVVWRRMGSGPPVSKNHAGVGVSPWSG